LWEVGVSFRKIAIPQVFDSGQVVNSPCSRELSETR
jgi:hypothetical protein